MMASGGDGGLSMGIELKEYTKVDVDIASMSDAVLVAQAFTDNRDYERSLIKDKTLKPPKLETNITKTSDGKFIVWYRDRI